MHAWAPRFFRPERLSARAREYHLSLSAKLTSATMSLLGSTPLQGALKQSPHCSGDGWQLCLRLPCNDPVLQSTGNILDEALRREGREGAHPSRDDACEEDAQALMEILAPIWPDGSWKGRGLLYQLQLQQLG